MITPTKRKRGHAKRPWSNAVGRDRQNAWMKWSDSPEGDEMCKIGKQPVYTAFMAGYRAGKGAK